MSWRPQLNAVCGRCGKPRGLFHECVSNSRRRQTVKPKLSFGTCPKCRKPLGNPLTHTCAPKSDFKRRKARAAKRAKAREREEARKKRQADKHDYQTCRDNDCKRSLCMAYKTGWKRGHYEGFKEGYAAGYKTGYEDGYRDGYAKGFPDGIAACPRPHK